MVTWLGACLDPRLKMFLRASLLEKGLYLWSTFLLVAHRIKWHIYAPSTRNILLFNNQIRGSQCSTACVIAKCIIEIPNFIIKAKCVEWPHLNLQQSKLEEWKHRECHSSEIASSNFWVPSLTCTFSIFNRRSIAELILPVAA